MTHSGAAAHRAVHGFNSLGGSFHARSSSPTATLLRNSRVFAIPQPLPRPDNSLTLKEGFRRISETATLPYPTHQAITTPPSSLGRGDWGLKRPLPLRATTSTSTPHLRINAVDTIEHVTEFESASEHTRTLEKFAEMQIPITKNTARETYTSWNSGARKSAFESSFDNTDKVTADRKELRLNRQLRVDRKGDYRWRFQGPWLGGMSQRQFERFIAKTTEKKDQAAFKTLIKAWMVTTKVENAIVNEKNAGLSTGNPDERREELRQAFQSEIDASSVDQMVQNLRSELNQWPGDDTSTTESQLVNSVIDFLDLPPVPSKQHLSDQLVQGKAFRNVPPATHPSAGLGYLRTSSTLRNHPFLGPQVARPPVPARVIQAKEVGHQKFNNARLGVAGIVVEDQKSMGDREEGVSKYDLENEGGKKLWVSPKYVSISANGRINMHIERFGLSAADKREGRMSFQAQLPKSKVSGIPQPERWMEALDSDGKAPQVEGFDVSELGLSGNEVGQDTSDGSNISLTQSVADLFSRQQQDPHSKDK